MYKLPTNYLNLRWDQKKVVREQYVKEQNGLCMYCNNPLTDEPAAKINSMYINWRLFPIGFQNNPIHLHHSHETHMTEGAVHMKCNAVLWQYERK